MADYITARNAHGQLARNGKPVCCNYCDRAAVIDWCGDPLCHVHFDSNGQRSAREAVRRSRTIAEVPRG